jgi:hypothetical protein
MKVCQGCLGQGRKGLIKVEGKQTYDRCDCNVPVLSKLTNGNSAMTDAISFIR